MVNPALVLWYGVTWENSNFLWGWGVGGVLEVSLDTLVLLEFEKTHSYISYIPLSANHTHLYIIYEN
jgi:hypothetical protein